MSCEARNCGSGEVLWAKRTFFQSLVWVSTPQRDGLFCFLFSGTIIVVVIVGLKVIQRNTIAAAVVQVLLYSIDLTADVLHFFIKS